MDIAHDAWWQVMARGHAGHPPADPGAGVHQPPGRAEVAAAPGVPASQRAITDGPPPAAVTRASSVLVLDRVVSAGSSRSTSTPMMERPGCAGGILVIIGADRRHPAEMLIRASRLLSSGRRPQPSPPARRHHMASTRRAPG